MIGKRCRILTGALTIDKERVKVEFLKDPIFCKIVKFEAKIEFYGPVFYQIRCHYIILNKMKAAYSKSSIGCPLALMFMYVCLCFVSCKHIAWWKINRVVSSYQKERLSNLPKKRCDSFFMENRVWCNEHWTWLDLILRKCTCYFDNVIVSFIVAVRFRYLFSNLWPSTKTWPRKTLNLLLNDLVRMKNSDLEGFRFYCFYC